MAREADILSIALNQSVEDASRSLCEMLVLLTREEPLNIVVNICNGGRLVAWRPLAQLYDSAAATGLSGLLLGLMNWSFSGDIQARIEMFQRELMRYENNTWS